MLREYGRRDAISLDRADHRTIRLFSYETRLRLVQLQKLHARVSSLPRPIAALLHQAIDRIVIGPSPR